jgi:8-oxo-dGTP diphosphatase
MQENYYENLPKKRMGVGALIFNEKDELLIVKPTYKDHWSIPGGVVDKYKSPRQACVREIKEEIGLDINDVRFLCVAYASDDGEKGESLQFVFYGGKLSDNESKNIKITGKEIGEYKFVKTEEATRLVSSGLGRRLPKSIEAIKNDTAFYLEDGV